ncbi:hypothetical protein CEXT_265891 [Caerostris extrusa]|uniref:Uncharacterized protein n=1 Tax=Caerostris extrusa TaxID=172846 RepID=A0AAV4WL79_CAEEX|nr:hypothetical protein CEXT_265891 [Caerostris extrusa]
MHFALLEVSFMDIRNPSYIIWDNFTTPTTAPTPFNTNKQAFFLIGMTFVGGLIIGFFLHCLYACMIKNFFSEFADDVSLDGVINFSFVGDDSRPPAYDPPPDYASVVSGDSGSESPTHNQRFLDFLRRIFRRRNSIESETDSIEEEGPPSYSTAIQSLERDLISR